MEEIIKVPEERVGVLIGPKGTVRRQIERKTKTNLEINSETGEVIVTGEGTNYLKATSMVHAIGRGFTPEKALRLYEDDYVFKIIEIPEIVGKSSSKQRAVKGRVIGKEGAARLDIEKKTNSFISVYGKTVAIIARVADMEAAIGAVEMLLGGAQHKTMDRYLAEDVPERFKL